MFSSISAVVFLEYFWLTLLLSSTLFVYIVYLSRGEFNKLYQYNNYSSTYLSKTVGLPYLQLVNYCSKLPFLLINYCYIILFCNLTYYFAYGDKYYFTLSVSPLAYIFSLLIVLLLLLTTVIYKNLSLNGLIKNIETSLGLISIFSALYYYLSLETLSAIVFLFELQSLIFMFFLASSFPNLLKKKLSVYAVANKYAGWYFSSLIFQFWISFLTSVFFIYSILNFVRFTGFVEWNELNAFYLFSYLTSSAINWQNWMMAISPLLAALFLKLGAFPFFLWKPEVYKTLNIYVLYLYMTVYMFSLLFFIIVFFYSYLFFFFNFWANFLYILVIFGIFFLSLSLFSITEVRPFLAYTASIHVCYILTSLYCKSQSSGSIAFFYLFTYFFYSLMFFFILFAVPKKSLWYFSDFSVVSVNSGLVLFLSIFMVGVAGIPPFFGFLAKTSTASLLLFNGEYVLFFLIIFSGVYVSFFYIQNYRFYGVSVKRISYRTTSLPHKRIAFFYKTLILFVLANFFSILISADLVLFCSYIALYL